MTHNKKASSKMISIKKVFTYQVAGKLKDRLISLLKSGTGAKISLTGIESIDLTALQLLVSASRSFGKENIPFHIELDCNEEIRSLITNCGFDYLTGKYSTIVVKKE